MGELVGETTEGRSHVSLDQLSGSQVVDQRQGIIPRHGKRLWKSLGAQDGEAAVQMPCRGGDQGLGTRGKEQFLLRDEPRFQAGFPGERQHRRQL